MTKVVPEGVTVLQSTLVPDQGPHGNQNTDGDPATVLHRSRFHARQQRDIRKVWIVLPADPVHRLPAFLKMEQYHRHSEQQPDHGRAGGVPKIVEPALLHPRGKLRYFPPAAHVVHRVQQGTHPVPDPDGARDHPHVECLAVAVVAGGAAQELRLRVTAAENAVRHMTTGCSQSVGRAVHEECGGGVERQRRSALQDHAVGLDRHHAALAHDPGAEAAQRGQLLPADGGTAGRRGLDVRVEARVHAGRLLPVQKLGDGRAAPKMEQHVGAVQQDLRRVHVGKADGEPGIAADDPRDPRGSDADRGQEVQHGIDAGFAAAEDHEARRRVDGAGAACRAGAPPQAVQGVHGPEGRRGGDREPGTPRRGHGDVLVRAVHDPLAHPHAVRAAAAGAVRRPKRAVAAVVAPAVKPRPSAPHQLRQDVGVIRHDLGAGVAVVRIVGRCEWFAGDAVVGTGLVEAHELVRVHPVSPRGGVAVDEDDGVRRVREDDVREGHTSRSRAHDEIVAVEAYFF
eukprot:CAMPEP_0194348548 /NCGR_PEP_ID=MMETSP0171-20130528/106594_1 /TAXON_ID=218684 /ORGANISM="Corethron pennatum, Strain L29A3" /LENGTH=510 /DNA_ID=CAMNT_0039115899 /DNA_START=119 /DNA_END=1650 /DNA_ORIENTATION=+